jgi:hypothetical protein
MRRDKLAHVKLYQPGCVTLFPVTAYEPITHALQSGVEWWEGTTLYGATMMVRLSTVTDVHLFPQEAIEAADADTDEAEYSGR